MRLWAVVTCQQFALVANDYLEGQLGLAARATARFHLSWCRHCRAYLRQLRQTIATLARLPRPAPAESLHRELLGRFRKTHGGGPDSGPG